MRELPSCRDSFDNFSKPATVVLLLRARGRCTPARVCGHCVRRATSSFENLVSILYRAWRHTRRDSGRGRATRRLSCGAKHSNGCVDRAPLPSVIIIAPKVPPPPPPLSPQSTLSVAWDKGRRGHRAGQTQHAPPFSERRQRMAVLGLRPISGAQGPSGLLRGLGNFDFPAWRRCCFSSGATAANPPRSPLARLIKARACALQIKWPVRFFFFFLLPRWP